MSTYLYHITHLRNLPAIIERGALCCQAITDHEKLTHVSIGYQDLKERLEGHLIRGYGDRSDSARITLLAGADQAAQKRLDSHQETLARFARVAELIEGFETPRGLELLTTVQWVRLHEPDIADDPEQIVQHVHNWNAHKQTFPENQIRTAWQRLHEQGW